MQPPRPPRPPRSGRRGKRDADAVAALAADERQGAADDPLAVDESAASADPRRFPCGQCGASLVYKPGTPNLICQYCGHENPIPQSAADIKEFDFRAVLARLAETHETEEHTTVKCSACAAEVDKPPNLTAMACPFCGSDIVMTARSQRLIKPKALLPFRIVSEEAQARFRQWLRKLWFAPNAVKKYARASRLQGVYVPYWTYDANTVSAYSGMRGEYYYVTVGSGKNRRRVRRTRWYPASGVVFNTFNDVLVVASQSLPTKYAERLEPWDLRNLTPYSDEYLSGFHAESYQVDLVEGFGRAREIMAEVIRETVRRDIGGDTQQIHSINTEHKNITFKHILLPIWVSAYAYKERTYRFLINARTGEVQGERPWSWVKITLAVLGGLIVVGAGLWIANEMGAFR